MAKKCCLIIPARKHHPLHRRQLITKLETDVGILENYLI